MIYKLLIVDDESRIRRGLTENIDWISMGFEVVGSESNGEKALQLIERSMPHVLLTDIRMPRMTGIELMNAVKARYPAVKIVVLSGYDEFDYAKQAIACGALEYILKPAKVDTIEKVFLKVKGVLDEETRKSEDDFRIKRQLKESLPVMRELFLSDLVRGNVKDENIVREKLNLFDINLGEKCFCVLTLNTGNPSVKKIVEEALLEYRESIFFTMPEDMTVVILSGNDEAANEKMDKEKHKLAMDIRSKVYEYLNFNVTVGIGGVYEGYGSICTSYKESRNAAQCKFYGGKNKLIINIEGYVYEHYMEDITLKSVAESFYINPEYLSRLFKKETGENFINFLLMVRMNKAMELIKDNKDLKAYEIAERVGYKDAKYFSRVFKKYARKNLYSYKTELFD